MKRIIVSLCKMLPTWCRVAVIPKGAILQCGGKSKWQIGQIKQVIMEHFEKRS
jgi:hypothetical protein